MDEVTAIRGDLFFREAKCRLFVLAWCSVFYYTALIKIVILRKTIIKTDNRYHTRLWCPSPRGEGLGMR